MNPQLQSILNGLASQARLNLQTHGYLLPVGFLFNDEEMHIIGCPFRSDEDKERTVVALQEKAREMNASLFVMLAEAWHADIPGGQWDGTPASEMPNRREVVQMYVESDDDGYWLGVAPITRDKGKPTFGTLQFTPMTERSACERFQKILA